MAKFLKPGKVVVVLNGRYAGKKAVIVKNMIRSEFPTFLVVAGCGALGWMDGVYPHRPYPSIPNCHIPPYLHTIHILVTVTNR